MTREEIIRDLVLSEISDDYENVDQCILPHVEQALAETSIRVERADIVDALRSLVADGIASVHRLSAHQPYETRLEEMPPLETPETDFETYSLVTAKGLEHVVSLAPHDETEVGLTFDEDLPPVLRSLRGSLKGTDIENYKAYLVKKYS